MEEQEARRFICTLTLTHYIQENYYKRDIEHDHTRHVSLVYTGYLSHRLLMELEIDFPFSI